MAPNAPLTADAQEGDGYSCYSSTEPPGALLPNGLTHTWPPSAPTFVSAEQTTDSNGNAFYPKMLTMESSGTNAPNATFYSGASPPTMSSLGSLDPRTRLFVSLKVRGFDSICLYNATDEDIIELATHPLLNDGSSSEKFTQVSIRHSSITDKGLEVFLASNARYLQSFELIGCNEIADSGLWTGLVPNLKCLSIQDCINISDETIAAICQLLTSLKTLQVQVMCYGLVICRWRLMFLQAYHVTDSSMAYFSTSILRETLRTLAISHCWEITNQGVVNLCHSLPNLTSLTLSGCSKVRTIDHCALTSA